VSAEPRARLHVDWTACQASGLCIELLREVLRADPWGYPLGEGGGDMDVPPALRGHARRAVASCPQLALRLERARERAGQPTASPSTTVVASSPQKHR